MTRPRDRARFLLAAALGSLPGAVLFTWMATAGTWRLFGWHPAADFYDAQAHALLDGHLDIPQSVLGIEAFVTGGRSYMYQGPFPAILRLPVVAVTDTLDGRLSVLSMLVAFVVTAAAVGILLWQIRQLVRPGEPVGVTEAVAVAGFMFAGTGGSLLVALASQTSVYYESVAWGIATGLVALTVLVRHLLRPARWTLAAASLATAACLWSRASIGIGMTGALGLLALGEFAHWWRSRRGRPEWPPARAFRPRRAASGRAVALSVLAVAIPVLLYSGLNVAKFDSVSSVPWGQQVFARVSQDRAQFLEENGGSFFGLRFVPSTAVAYLRPDALSVRRRYPWIGFRTEAIGRRTVVGDVLFDKVDATGSIPVAYPLLGLLGLAGLLAIARDHRLRVLAGPLLGAAAGAAAIFVFGYIALRYLGDTYPLVVPAAAVGFVAATAWLRRVSRWWRTAAVTGLVVLGLFGSWANVGQGLTYQRVYASPGDEPATRALFDRARTAPVLPAGHGTAIAAGAHLPRRGSPGDLYVVGACDGLYVSDGATIDALSHTNWKPVARTPAVGAYDVDMTFPRARRGATEPLLVSGTSDQPNVLGVRYLGGGRIRVTYRGAGFGDGRVAHVTAGRTYRVRLALDHETDTSIVTLDERTIFSGVYGDEAVPELGINRLDSSTSARFGGTITPRAQPRDLCRALARDAGISGPAAGGAGGDASGRAGSEPRR